VHGWEEKTVNGFIFEYDTVPTPAVPGGKDGPRATLIDLTANMQPDAHSLECAAGA